MSSSPIGRSLLLLAKPGSSSCPADGSSSMLSSERPGIEASIGGEFELRFPRFAGGADPFESLRRRTVAIRDREVHCKSESELCRPDAAGMTIGHVVAVGSSILRPPLPSLSYIHAQDAHSRPCLSYFLLPSGCLQNISRLQDQPPGYCPASTTTDPLRGFHPTTSFQLSPESPQPQNSVCIRKDIGLAPFMPECESYGILL